MKKIIIVSALVLASFAAGAMENTDSVPGNKSGIMTETEEIQIIKDEIADGVRVVSAIPSPKVCSRQIDIRIKDGIVLDVVYTRGCEGNAKGIGALIRGMSVAEAIERLEGITCGKRGTSCPDQLAKVLKAISR